MFHGRPFVRYRLQTTNPRQGKHIPSPARWLSWFDRIALGISRLRLWPCNNKCSKGNRNLSCPKLYSEVDLQRHGAMFLLFVNALYIGFCDTSQYTSLSNSFFFSKEVSGPHVEGPSLSAAMVSRIPATLSVSLRALKGVHGLTPSGILHSWRHSANCPHHAGAGASWWAPCAHPRPRAATLVN